MAVQLKSYFKVISNNQSGERPLSHCFFYLLHGNLCLVFTNNRNRLNLKMLRHPSLLRTRREPFMTNKLNVLRALSEEKIRLYQKREELHNVEACLTYFSDAINILDSIGSTGNSAMRRPSCKHNNKNVFHCKKIIIIIIKLY